MKNILAILLFAAALGLTGCSTLGNYAAFIQKIPAVTATDITQTTTTPVYSHSESASGVTTDPSTGQITVTNGKASVAIPELGVSSSLNISGLKVQATPAQLAAAAALQAQQQQPSAK